MYIQTYSLNHRKCKPSNLVVLILLKKEKKIPSCKNIFIIFYNPVNNLTERV